MATGTVKCSTAKRASASLSRDGGGADVFVHYTAIESGGYRELQEGQKVEFDVTQGPKGPQGREGQGHLTPDTSGDFGPERNPRPSGRGFRLVASGGSRTTNLHPGP